MYSTLKDCRGQALVEFALCIPVILLFVYGLITAFTWGATGILAQSIAHEGARKFAVSSSMAEAEARAKAERVATDYMDSWGRFFADPDYTAVTVRRDYQTVSCRVSVVPRIKKLFVFEITEITRESTSVLEHVWRDPSKYKW